MRFCLLFLFLFNISALADENIPKAVQQAEKAVWKIGDGEYSVMGSFISPTLIVTSLDVAFNLFVFNRLEKKNHFQELKLSQKGKKSNIKLKGIHNLSLAHNLIIFETDQEVSHHLKLPSKVLKLANSIFTIDHSNGSFMRIKNEIFSNGNRTLPTREYLFTGSFNAKNASGVPVLNSQGNLMGIIKSAQTTGANHRSNNHVVTITELNPLKKLTQVSLSKNESTDIQLLIGEAFAKEKVQQINSPSVQYILGKLFENKELPKKYMQHSIDWYKESAEGGFALAQNTLGFKFYYGKEVDQNYKKSVYWYEKAAKQKDSLAQYNLGLSYYYGEGISQDYEKAGFWFEQAAKQDYFEAQYNLGLMYYNGKGVDKNFEKAMYWLKKSAEQGHYLSQLKLAEMYYYGKGTKQDFEKSYDWITKVINTLYKYKIYNMKQFHFDAIRIFKLQKKLAKQGHADAQYHLAIMIWNGEGTKRNFKKAISWFEVAAEQGHAFSQTEMGNELHRGIYIEQNLKKGSYFYHLAAEQGNAEAQYKLGMALYGGIGISQNYKKAIEQFRKAAEQDFTPAQYELGLMYYNGKGVSQNYKKAFELINKTVKKDYVPSQYVLGLMYYNGKGVDKNFEKAMYWFKQAAEQGNAQAQYKLGIIFYEGKEVDQDLNMAIYWLKKSAKQKFNLAVKDLKIIKKSMSLSDKCLAVFTRMPSLN